MESIKLNLIPSGVNPTCHCSQYDEGRVIRVELFDGLTPYALQSGDAVTLNVRKPDNTIVTTSLTATQGNKYVDIVTTEQICACVGYNLCDLTITNGSTVIGTLNFIMAIERDVLADGIPSQSVIEDLDALVQEAVGDNYYTKTEIDDLLDDINNDIESIDNILEISENEVYSFSAVSTSPLTKDLQWLLVRSNFSSGNKISKIVLGTSAADNTNITIGVGLWTVSGTTATRYYHDSISGVAKNGSITFITDITVLHNNSIISFDTSDNILRTASTSSGTIKNISMELTTAVISPALNYDIVSNIYIITNVIEQLKADISTLDSDLSVLTQEIHVGEGLEYEEIQEALDSLTSDYATIIVHPKDTPYSRFSLMRKLSDAYPWNGLTTVKHISIIGVDKSKCIIKDESGDYNTPPAEIATNGVIENLTFIATHNNSIGTETTGSYAVHVDNRPADINGMKLIFRNCDFTSYQMSAVGLGLYRNQDILFDSCNFYSYTDINWKPNQDYNSNYFCALGAFFMHTTMGYAGGNMFIRFRNCFLYHSGGSYSMRIEDNDTTKTALFEALNNTCWCEDSDDTDVLISGMNLQPYNNGNNAANLNG